MKRLLILLLLLIPSICFSAPDKIAIIFSNTNNSVTNDKVQCARQLLENGGWRADWYNADNRNWQTGNDDPTWFSSRYKAAIVVALDGHNAYVTAGGFGTNFKDAGGTARVAYSPLGGRWTIPCYVLTTRVVPNTSYNDTTATNFVCGINHTSPSGSFARSGGTSWDNWRYKLIARLKTDKDSLYCDPLQFACAATTWAGAGSVAAIAFIDSGYSAGVLSCAAGDTCVAAWKWVPRPDKAGVIYYLFNQAYQAPSCWGMMLALQRIATETTAKPGRIISIPIMEHDSRPVSYTATRIANYKTLQDKLNSNYVYRTMTNPTAPVAGEINLYTNDIINKSNEGINSRIVKWTPFSYLSGWHGGVFNGPSDTTNFRQAWNELIRCAVNPDTFGYAINGLTKEVALMANGETSVWYGKVLKDAGLNIVETTFLSPNASGLTFQAPSSGKPLQLTQYLLPGNDFRTIYTRYTLALPHAQSFTPGTHVATIGDNEYVGSTWMPIITTGMLWKLSLYWHTGGANGVATDDPYWQWLMGNAFTRQLGYFDKIARIDPFTNPKW